VLNTFIKSIYIESESSISILSFIRDAIISASTREAYGIRSKDAVAFENIEPTSLWTWEITKVSCFTSSEQSIIKECQSVRRRYSRAIKAFLKVVDQLHCSKLADDIKVLQAEEKAVRALSEVEKAKEKRVEIEKKKAADKLEKALKEEARLLKMKEKEESLARKREEAAAEAAALAEKKRIAEEAVAAEKAAMLIEKKLLEIKEAKKIEKQRNILHSFLQSSLPSKSDSVDLLETASIPRGLNSSSIEVLSGEKRKFDEEKFADSLFNNGFSRSDALRQHRERYQF
jgi:hypothetical protein